MMKLTTVISSVNDNSHYYNFIPYQIEVWRKFNINFIALYVGESIPDELQQFSDNIILWDKNLDINSVYVGQMLRVLYPALLDLPDDELVMVTDMDMLPSTQAYYTDGLDSFEKKDFLTYKKPANKMVYICYNAAHPDTWGEVFGVKSEQDVEKALYDNRPSDYTGAHGGAGWYADQLFMYDKLINYDSFKVLNRSRRRLEMSTCSKLVTRRTPGFINHYDDIPFHRSFFNHLRNLEYVCNVEMDLMILRGPVNKRTNRTWWIKAEDVTDTQKTVGKLCFENPQLKKNTWGWLPNQSMDVDVSMETLVEITDVFDAHDQNYRVVFGSLLGLHRDGRLIDHDKDIDIAFDYDDTANLYGAIKDLEQLGYSVLRVEDFLVSLWCRRKSCYIDLYFFKSTSPDRLAIYKYELTPDDFTSDTTLTCNGKKLKTVKDPEYFCKKYYGPRWQTPIKQFSATPHKVLED